MKPGPEHRRLGVFVGRWHTTGEVAPERGQTTPGAKIDCIDTYEWYPGGFFVVHDVDGKVGDEPVKSMEVLGYDGDRGRYFAMFFDSTGGFGAEELTVDGNTWTWRGSNVMGVKGHRCVSVLSEDGETLRARHEKSDDGESWQPWMDVTLRRMR